MTDAARLISAVLPFTTSGEGIENLLMACGEILCSPIVGVAWCSPCSSSTELVLWDSERGFSRHRRSETEAFTHLVALVGEPAERTLTWSPLAGSRVIGRWGLPEAISSAISGEITEVAARLLETVVLWESTLREKKLASLAEFAAGAGHEINNPLGTITGRTAQLLKDEPDPERRRMLEAIGAQAYRIRDMIGDTMTFARPPAPVRELLDLTEQVGETLTRFETDIRDREIMLEVIAAEGIPVFADPTQLAVVISELMRNSLTEVSDGGTISLFCESFQLNDAPWARLRMVNDGPELTMLEREHCFDPFFSGRQAGRGLGFGLSKCWRIVQQHQGSLELIRSTPSATEFEVCLPACESQ